MILAGWSVLTRCALTRWGGCRRGGVDVDGGGVGCEWWANAFYCPALPYAEIKQVCVPHNHYIKSFRSDIYSC